MLSDAHLASLAGGAGLGSDEALADRAGGMVTSRLGAPRVMLVEDDFILRAHLAELLVLEGYRVTCAADGAEALRRLKTEPPPSVILVDILMPRLNGVAFRKLQLATPGLRDIPTVALTSLVDIDDGGNVRFAGLIRKPVNLDHLLETVAKLCPRA